VSRPTIQAWLADTTYTDNRGWKEGTGRRYSKKEALRVKSIKKEMVKNEDYFVGAPYVQMNYATQHPDLSLPSEWFINQVTRDHNLQTRVPKKKQKGQGIVERLRYPACSLVKLGRIQQSVDYIGKKFISGQTKPISIFATSYYQWLKLYRIYRVFSETAEAAITSLSDFWKTFPLPNVLRMDNGMPFRGTGVQEGHIGRFVTFLLNLGITPLFSAQYQSFTNPHIEGHNSTFTQKLWSRHAFGSPEEIDIEIERFNAESKTFYEWKHKERLAQSSLRFFNSERSVSSTNLHSTYGKRVYFLRQVARWEESDHRFGIVILNRFVDIPSEYYNLYVLCILNLHSATLSVTLEIEGNASEILSVPFAVVI
jgi:hypothetical protein